MFGSMKLSWMDFGLLFRTFCVNLKEVLELVSYLGYFNLFRDWDIQLNNN